MMYNRKNLIIAGVAVLVIGAIIWIFAGKKPSSENQPGTSGGAVSQTSSGPVTREAPPANVVVPSLGATDVPEGVAVPQTVSQASVSDASVSMRSFSIKAQGNQFTPDTVIVKQGDKVDISVTAIDKDYDFTQPDYGFKMPIPKGTTKSIRFGATAAGKFTFYCASCGGPASGPIGYIVIATK